MEPKYVVFSDGSYNPYSNCQGIGFVVADAETLTPIVSIGYPVVSDKTNVAEVELLAIIEAINYVAEHFDVRNTLFLVDSTFVVDKVSDPFSKNPHPVTVFRFSQLLERFPAIRVIHYTSDKSLSRTFIFMLRNIADLAAVEARKTKKPNMSNYTQHCVIKEFINE